MRQVCSVILAITWLLNAAAQESVDAARGQALEAAGIIEMKRRAWEQQQRRDPAYFQALRRNLSRDYVYKEGENQADANRYLRNVENTYLEEFQLSDFVVTFPSPTDAVLTHKAIFRIRASGKSVVKSCYYTTVLKKKDGVWYELSYIGRPAR